jgi:hypothetical protein
LELQQHRGTSDMTDALDRMFATCSTTSPATHAVSYGRERKG